MDLTNWIYAIIVKFKLSVWVIQTVAMFATAIVLPSLKITELKGAFLTILGLAFINTYLWDAALFFFIPNELSLHVLSLVLCNGIILWLLIKLLPGIEISGFIPAVLAAVLFTAFSVLLDISQDYIDWMKFFEYMIDLVHQLRTYFLSGAKQ